MFLKIRFFAVVFLVGQVGLASFTRAQSLPATPHTPDLLGIYPGMPGPAAKAQLQKLSSTINVHTLSPASMGFSLTIPSHNRETIAVYLTQEPNDPFVWLIERGQNFDQANPMSKDALLAGLHQKYGKETLKWDKGGGGLYLYWIFDQSGKLLTTADQTLQACESGQFSLYMNNGLPQAPTQVEQACFKSYFAVKAGFNLGPNGMLYSYNVELVNLPYAHRAALNTANAKNAVDQKAQQDLIKRANQNKPTF